MKGIFPGVFREGKRLYTLNTVPGKKVYGEKLIKENNMELREWSPERSKLAAAIMCGLQEMKIGKGSKVLYLGASTGTTVSHISDITGSDGIIYAVEFSERVFRNLLRLAAERKNVVPLLADARKLEYAWVEEVDCVYVDIAQQDESAIALRNADEFLKRNGCLMVAIKSQSIDVTKEPADVYEAEKGKIEAAGYRVAEMIDIGKFEKGHAFLVAEK